MPEAVFIDAPAKVNLRLRVLEREVSGYHSLETLFCAVSLTDSVELRRGAPGVDLCVEGGISTGPPARNLATRAATAFFRAINRDPAICIRLHKRIPSAAGLGGGSSDAAAVLRALNALYETPLSADTLLRIGAQLGADVPFFLCGSTLALAWGRGERMLTLPSLPPRPVLIAHPGVEISTPDAFTALGRGRSADSNVEASAISLERLRTWEGVAALAENDFLGPASQSVPGVKRAIRVFGDAGASIALLSGSGAAVFGVFGGEEEREHAAAAVESEGWTTWRTATLEVPLPPRVDPPEAVA